MKDYSVQGGFKEGGFQEGGFKEGGFKEEPKANS